MSNDTCYASQHYNYHNHQKNIIVIIRLARVFVMFPWLMIELHSPVIQWLCGSRIVTELLTQRCLQCSYLFLGHLSHLWQAKHGSTNMQIRGKRNHLYLPCWRWKTHTLPRMLQMTFSVHGGVVRDPKYLKYSLLWSFSDLVCTTPTGMCASLSPL